MKKRILSILLCALLVCGLLPTSALAAPSDAPLSNASQNQNIDAGSISKNVSDTGFYQRMPRLTDTCRSCGGVLREFIPDDYFGCSYTLSDEDVLSDCSFKVGTFKQSGDYNGLPCLEFDYKAASPGTTTVKLTFYYQFDADQESGYCDICGNYVTCSNNYNHYYDTVTFKVNVSETYSLSYDANGGSGAPATESKKSTEKSQEFAVSTNAPTRDDYTFVGWSDSEDGDASYQAGDKITLSYEAPSKTIYAVWQTNQKYTVTYTDGVEGEEVFADQVYSDLLSGTTTPAFDGTPTREGYVFKGWTPAVAETVTADAAYTAVWGEDKNNNGVADDEEDKYIVTYTDGVEGEEVFADQIYSDLLSGTATPAFDGTPTREGYVFKGWTPAVAETVTADAAYTAVWGEDKNNNGVADDEEDKYIVTYTDGVEGEEVFADQIYSDLLSGTATPAFDGTPTREGYVFKGWTPAVAETVTDDAVYTAVWGEDKNNNGVADDEEDKYTVTYTDGVEGEEVFADQVYSDLLSGTATPAFDGTPTREGYVFKGWTPAVSETVTADATYTAVWEKSPSSNKSGGTTNSSNTSKSSGSGASKSNTSVSSPKTGDESNITLWIVLFAFSGIALAGVLVYKRRKTN